MNCRLKVPQEIAITPEALKQRSKQFALRVMALCDRLPGMRTIAYRQNSKSIRKATSQPFRHAWSGYGALLLLLVLSACGGAGETAATPTPIAATALPSATPSAAALPTTAPPLSGKITSERSAQIDTLFASYKGDVPGAAVIVIHNGKVLHGVGYGLANLESRTPVTPQTIFHMASSGKQFTGTAIILLAAEGKLQYDDPITRFLPELNRIGSTVTVRQLLHHTGGIPETDDELRDRFPNANPTNQDELNLLKVWGERRFTPGAKFKYSNAGYELLGSIVERASGQMFATFMHTRIFKPLGMRNTFSYDKAKLTNPMRALGYDVKGSKFTLNDVDQLDNLFGSGSIYSTNEDLYYYDQALYTDKLVSQAALQEALKPAVLSNGREYPYGFGWEVGVDRGMPFMAHAGAWSGFSAYMVRYPQHKFSVMVLANRSDADLEDLVKRITGLYMDQIK